MVYAKAAMKGLEHSPFFDINTSENDIKVNGKTVYLNYGYIKPNSENIKRILDISDGDWNIKETGTIYGPVYMTPKTASAFNAKDSEGIKKLNCYLSYSFLNSHDSFFSGNYSGNYEELKIPQYHLETSGC